MRLIKNLLNPFTNLFRKKKKLRPTIIYLETSALNAFADGSPSIKDAQALSDLFQNNNILCCISPVILWEVLITSDEERREKLIIFMQHALHNKLLCTPTELIIDYFEAGCPLEESYRKSLFTNSHLGEVWNDIFKDKSKTFIYSKDELKILTKRWQKLLKTIDLAFKENNTGRKTIIDYKAFADNIYGLLSDENKEITEKSNRVPQVKLTGIINLLVFGIGVEMDNSYLQKFKERYKISNDCELIWYLTRKEDVFYRGPTAIMGEMIFTQIQEDKKLNRGYFWDALHTTYLPYVDIVLTEDEHFYKLKNKMNHPMFKKIIYLKKFIRNIE